MYVIDEGWHINFIQLDILIFMTPRGEGVGVCNQRKMHSMGNIALKLNLPKCLRQDKQLSQSKCTETLDRCYV